MKASAAGDVFTWGHGATGCRGHNDEQGRLAPARLGREQCRGDKIVRCGCDEVEVLMLGPCSRDGVTRQGVC